MELVSIPTFSLFKKIMRITIIMLIPIIGLYVYSNKTSTDVLRTQLHESSRNQLQFFQQQMDSTIHLISMWPNLLIYEPDISELKDNFQMDNDYLDLKTIELMKRIQKKISIQENSINWDSNVMIYSPSLRQVLTASSVYGYNHADVKKRLKQGWQIRKVRQNDGKVQHYFSLITVTPYSSFHSPEDANLIIEVEFTSDNIVRMLDSFHGDGHRNPFYYIDKGSVIYNSGSDHRLIDELLQKLTISELATSYEQVVKLQGESYLVNMERSTTTGWMLVDYLPLSEVLSPVKQSNLLFYYSVIALVMMSIVVVYLLYVQVQVPINQLVISFQKLEDEDYSIRLQPKGKGEFSFLFTRFNSMAAQIQDLFQRSYLEQIHIREAKLKQLQSQINPHFIYNCFSFISSMAKLENYKAIIKMSENLSDYYRYITRQERDFVTLKEEIELVVNYLDIGMMRMNRLHYTIHMPVSLEQLSIPPLVIQPLVENAMIHGVEPHLDAGEIMITVEERLDGMIAISVEDDGEGLSEIAMHALQKRMDFPMNEDMGCGLWNVHQRLHLRYGEQAGINLSRSTLGGQCVTLCWTPEFDGEVGLETND